MYLLGGEKKRVKEKKTGLERSQVIRTQWCGGVFFTKVIFIAGLFNVKPRSVKKHVKEKTVLDFHRSLYFKLGVF